MEIAATSTIANSQSSTAGATLAQDFDTFLLLLTTQLKNQDPLEPLDSSEFTDQLVQFSGVEQSIQQNKNLESLIALFGAQNSAAAVSYLGKEITVESPTNSLADGSVDWLYEIAPGVSTTKLTIEDANGVKLFETSGETDAGLHSFTWDGIDQFGSQLPDGQYRLKVEAKSLDDRGIGATVLVRERVNQIESHDGSQFLAANGLLYSPGEVRAVRTPEPSVLEQAQP